MQSSILRRLLPILVAVVALGLPTALFAATSTEGGKKHLSEASLVLPDLSSMSFIGLPGNVLLMLGLAVCAGGLVFGLIIYMQLQKMPVHQAMKDISELIYETCKTYLLTQLKFIAILELFIGAIMVIYFKFFAHD